MPRQCGELAAHCVFAFFLAGLAGVASDNATFLASAFAVSSDMRNLSPLLSSTVFLRMGTLMPFVAVTNVTAKFGFSFAVHTPTNQKGSRADPAGSELTERGSRRENWHCALCNKRARGGRGLSPPLPVRGGKVVAAPRVEGGAAAGAAGPSRVHQLSCSAVTPGNAIPEEYAAARAVSLQPPQEAFRVTEPALGGTALLSAQRAQRSALPVGSTAGLDGDAVARGNSASTAATAPSRSPSSSMSSTAEAPDGKKRPSVTKLLKRYKKEDFVTLGESLGNGSYGSVTKVKHAATGEIFAMKAIPKKKVTEHQMNAYLFREVSTQFRMDHPNIIKLFYWFEDASYVSLLLEYADGGSLFSVMRKRQRVPEPEAARLFLDVSAALHYLHRKGIVHRDLKPENILMVGGTDSGRGAVAKLADFGWCGELKKDGEQRNTFCGTWDYLSPEMVENEPHGPAVDVWAMGVLLYEMLCGRPPFTDPNQKKAMDRITQVDLRFGESTPVLAMDLMRGLLKREPDARLTLEDAIRQPWVRQFIPDAQIDGRSSIEVAGSLPDRPCRPSTGPPSIAEAPPPAAPEPSPGTTVDAAQDAEQ
ncbi:unnamed protein product, partial [Prorocentrum cordatum]